MIFFAENNYSEADHTSQKFMLIHHVVSKRIPLSDELLRRFLKASLLTNQTAFSRKKLARGLETT